MKWLRRLLNIGIIAGAGAVIYRVFNQYRQDSAFERGAVMQRETPQGGMAVGQRRGISPELLEILACPADKSPVELQGDEWLVCHTCGRKYPIEDGIPIMLIEEGDKHRDESLITRPEQQQ
ncbi:MAG: hypothetical protein KatS3mg057_1862 [Herpetosiphonaceae bacterium]|nr:MAG: hypothetical protein KatS3mg057_1862 [Herpetosiphonaceae bacterium]